MSRALAPALAVGLAFAVKFVALTQLGGHPLLQPLGDLDGAFYVDLARRMVAQGPLDVGDVVHVSPLYVYFLATVFALGGDLPAARLVQVALGAIAVGCIHATARRWYGTSAAAVAAGAAIFTGVFTFYEVIILQAALDPFLVASALLLVSRAADRQDWVSAAGAGVALGALTLNRPNAFPYAVVAAAGLYIVGRRLQQARAHERAEAPPGAPRALPALACAVATLAVLAANGARNLAASGAFVLIASHGGLNFYIGNHEGADGTYQRVPGIAPSLIGQLRDAAREAEVEAGRRLTTSEVSGVFYARAFRWILAEPVAAGRLAVRKLLLVVNHANVPLNYSYEYYRRDESTILRGLFVGAWLLVPLGIAGFALAGVGAAPRGFWVWGAFVPVYAVSVAAFFVASRYRVPLLVPLCVAAGGAVAQGVNRIRVGGVPAVAWPCATLVAGAVMAGWPLGVDEGRGNEQTRKAVWLVEAGRIDEARAFVADVAPVHTHPGVLHFRLAEALAEAGRVDVAISHYEHARALDGPRPAIMLPLGQALVVVGRSREAVEPLTAAFEANVRRDVTATWLVRALVLAGERQRAAGLLDALPPDLADARPELAHELASLALQNDTPDRAVRWSQRAVVLSPARADAHDQLGATLLMLDRPEEAVAPLEAACRLDPGSVTARVNLALALARVGRVGAALEWAREARRLAPVDPRVTDLIATLEQAPR